MPSVSIYRPPAARKLEENANLSNMPPREMVANNTSPEKNKLKCTEDPKEIGGSMKRNESNGISVFRNAISSIRTQNKIPECKNVESVTRKSEVGKQEEVAKNAVQNKQRRPDIQVYVPKGRRSAAKSGNDTKVSVSPAEEDKSCKSPEMATRVEENTQPHKDKPSKTDNSVAKQTPEVSKAEVTQKPPADTKETNPVEKTEVKKVSNNVQSNSGSEKNSENKNGGGKASPESINPEECDWESMFDDNGECLNPSLLEQLTSAVGEVTIEKPKSSYNGYKTKSLDMVADEFPHVIEIYNFPPEFQLQDLMTVFSQFRNSGFEIKWVDDTHALGIFSSSAIVSEVLSFYHPFVKTRSLREGTPLSKMKARRSAEFLQPYKPRPDTCPALARRLVTGALGVKLPTSREEREAEKKILTKAREKKRLEAKQREDAWEGTFS